jgi:hypothetical protein
MIKAKHMKFIVLAISLLIPVVLLARQDPLYINLSAYDQHGFSSFDTGLGPPPIKLGSALWINSFSYRQHSLATELFNQRLKPSALGYSSLLKNKLDDNWSSTLGVSLSSRNSYEGIHLRSQSIFTSGFLFFSRPLGLKQNWIISMGLVVPDRSSNSKVIPAIGFRFKSSNGRHELDLTYPEFGYTNHPSANWRWGTFLSYEKSTYLLANEFIRINENNIYLKQSVIKGGLLASAKLHSGLWGNFRVGQTFWAQTAIQDRNFETQNQLGRQRGLYLLGGLSWRFE